MTSKIEGRGNDIKTNVYGWYCKHVGKACVLNNEVFWFWSWTQSNFDEKNGSSHVNEVRDTAKLAGLVENFINKYVKCYGCGNRETIILFNFITK